MTTALAERGRAAFAWAGIGLFALIAADALANLAVRVIRSLGRLPNPEVVLGLLALAVAILGAAALLAAAWRLASSGPSGERLALVGGLLLLGLIRLALSAAVDPPTDGEMQAFDDLARRILDGQCCFDDRATGYPMVLAVAYAILGVSPTTVGLLNLGLGVAAGGALYALVRSHAGVHAGTLALYLLALWPAGALLSNARLSETLYVAIVLLGALAATSRGRSWRLAALTGAALAAGQYVRPTTLALVPAFLLVRALPFPSWRPAAARAVVPLGGALLLLLLPVVAYNVAVHGEISLSTSAYGGWSLYVGTDRAHGGRWSRPTSDEIQALAPGGTWEDSKAAAQLAVDRILADLPGFGRLAARKFDTMWGAEDFGVTYGLARRSTSAPGHTFPTLASGAFYAGVAGLAVIALFRRRRRLDPLTVLAIGVTLTVAVVHTFLEVRDRYHAYVTPLLIALAAAGVARWIEERRGSAILEP